MAPLHPVIKVVSFLIAALFLALGSPSQLFLILLLTILLYLYVGLDSLKNAWRMLKRMRWFFLSILIIFFWLTPGEPLYAGAPDWLPSDQGLSQGLFRVLALVLMVFGVNLLLNTARREELVAAVYRLSAPLAVLGLDRARLAVRMALVLDAVPQLQTFIKQEGRSEGDERELEGRLSWIGTAASRVYGSVLARAEEASLDVVEVDTGSKIDRHQWLVPILFAVLTGVA